jgi:hypothetical protein
MNHEAFCSATTHQCALRASTPAAPLREFTFTQQTNDLGAIPLLEDQLVVHSDGRLELIDARTHEARVLSVSTSEIGGLARALAAPSFVAIRSTELGGEGQLTAITVTAPGRNQAVHFPLPGPAEARDVIDQAARLRDLVRRYAPEAASAPACASDADCVRAECGCQWCLPRHRNEGPAPNCRPARCMSSPCLTNAFCDPTVHRCALQRPGLAPAPPSTTPPAAGPCTSDDQCDLAVLGCGCEPLLRAAPHTPYIRPCGTSEPNCSGQRAYCDATRGRCMLRPAAH